MREELTHFDRRNSRRSGEGGCNRIPDQERSIQNHNNITSNPSKDHPAARARHSLHEDNIAHYHIKTVPAPAPKALTPSFQLQYLSRRGQFIA